MDAERYARPVQVSPVGFGNLFPKFEAHVLMYM